MCQVSHKYLFVCLCRGSSHLFVGCFFHPLKSCQIKQRHRNSFWYIKVSVYSVSVLCNLPHRCRSILYHHSHLNCEPSPCQPSPWSNISSSPKDSSHSTQQSSGTRHDSTTHSTYINNTISSTDPTTIKFCVSVTNSLQSLTAFPPHTPRQSRCVASTSYSTVPPCISVTNSKAISFCISVTHSKAISFCISVTYT